MNERPDETDLDLRRWLLFIYRVPQSPPGRRTYVWRQLKGLGAAYLQQAAAILPDKPDLRTSLEALVVRVGEFAGEASLLETTSPSPEWESQTIARFYQGRDAEYAELVENVERFEDEIARESRKQKFTFAELEELEADWEKLQRWRERIQARDFFEASSRAEAEEALTRARSALDAFTTEVYAHEDPEPEAIPGGGGHASH